MHQPLFRPSYVLCVALALSSILQHLLQSHEQFHNNPEKRGAESPYFYGKKIRILIYNWAVRFLHIIETQWYQNTARSSLLQTSIKNIWKSLQIHSIARLYFYIYSQMPVKLKFLPVSKYPNSRMISFRIPDYPWRPVRLDHFAHWQIRLVIFKDWISPCTTILRLDSFNILKLP